MKKTNGFYFGGKGKIKPIRKYLRHCSRCDNLYRTDKRKSKICSECKLPGGCKKGSLLLESTTMQQDALI